MWDMGLKDSIENVKLLLCGYLAIAARASGIHPQATAAAPAAMFLTRSALIAAALLIWGCVDRSATEGNTRANPQDAAQVALGAKLYTQHCAACHGARLEGQPNWRLRLPNGRLPAPPHDDSGHTWHHADAVLFAITKNGLVAPHAPAGYESDMPAFAGQLSDEEIWAVLAYIKSHWTQDVLGARAEMLRNARRP